ncbi:hypothetical protein B0H10DRAFT_1960368 [Mycena sp. CBHHK59/15]|nr:hypothetical protein B0H10DRAFT_1960368 [Mycena sp. CBHHK59/15]
MPQVTLWVYRGCVGSTFNLRRSGGNMVNASTAILRSRVRTNLRAAARNCAMVCIAPVEQRVWSRYRGNAAMEKRAWNKPTDLHDAVKAVRMWSELYTRISLNVWRSPNHLEPFNESTWIIDPIISEGKEADMDRSLALEARLVRAATCGWHGHSCGIDRLFTGMAVSYMAHTVWFKMSNGTAQSVAWL